jgi:nitroreductase
MSDQLLKTIKSRRVIRNMTDKQVERTQLENILEAGRWAPAGGNQRTNRFVAIQDPLILNAIRMFAPGMYQRPSAAILICIDGSVVDSYQSSEMDRTPYIDLGATMQTMMLAAHAIGLGSGPVTSFSKAAVRVILNLPSNLSPEILICFGYPGPKSQLPMRPKKKVTWQSLTDWERFKE